MMDEEQAVYLSPIGEGQPCPDEVIADLTRQFKEAVLDPKFLREVLENACGTQAPPQGPALQCCAALLLTPAEIARPSEERGRLFREGLQGLRERLSAVIRPVDARIPGWFAYTLPPLRIPGGADAGSYHFPAFAAVRLEEP